MVGQPTIYLKNITHNTMDPPLEENLVFISLQVASMQESARVLKSFLEAHGLNVWLCTENLQAGEDFRDGIVAAVKRSGVFVPLLNDAWGASGECKDEFNFAKRRNLTTGRPTFVPIAFKNLQWSKYPHVELLAASVNFVVHPGDALVAGDPDTTKTLQRVLEGISIRRTPSTEKREAVATSMHSGLASPKAVLSSSIERKASLTETSLQSDANDIWTGTISQNSSKAHVLEYASNHYNQLFPQRTLDASAARFITENIDRIAGAGQNITKEKFDAFWLWFRSIEIICTNLSWLWTCTDPIYIHGFTSRVDAEKQVSSPSSCVVRFGSNPATLAVTVNQSAKIDHKLMTCRDDGCWLMWGSSTSKPPAADLRFELIAGKSWLGPFEYPKLHESLQHIPHVTMIAGSKPFTDIRPPPPVPSPVSHQDSFANYSEVDVGGGNGHVDGSSPSRVVSTYSAVEDTSCECSIDNYSIATPDMSALTVDSQAIGNYDAI